MMKHAKKSLRVFCLVLAMAMAVQAPMSVNAASAKTKLVSQAKTKAKKIYKKKKKKADRLKVCYNWTVKRKYAGKFYKKSGKNWYVKYASDMLKAGKGNCYSYSTAFAYLAKACKYKKVYIVVGKMQRDPAIGMREHCWVTINGKVYDPQTQKITKKNLYGTTYAKAAESNITYKVSKKYKIA